ncbi:hypothetical protein THAOC_06332 [Thalassiosira oceanica]|uniref:Uncharacterized protein n=1 Tax=Thalassiosira oceanica TaxID=159749 RepID=K0T4Y0_THAOC|nr:hypothetical protein THAOC_06332 [Thalassiosira oceanica]|eukprot:EJK72164.1 hypothetical protein THAOC_06332 [Thalassiosira oceanica]
MSGESRLPAAGRGTVRTNPSRRPGSASSWRPAPPDLASLGLLRRCCCFRTSRRPARRAPRGAARSEQREEQGGGRARNAGRGRRRHWQPWWGWRNFCRHSSGCCKLYNVTLPFRRFPSLPRRPGKQIFGKRKCSDPKPIPSDAQVHKRDKHGVDDTTKVQQGITGRDPTAHSIVDHRATRKVVLASASGHQEISLRDDPKPRRERYQRCLRLSRPGCRARARRRWTGPVTAAASALASGPIRSSFRAGIPSARTASGKTDSRTLPVNPADTKSRRTRFLRFLLLISGWKSKYTPLMVTEQEEQRGRRCPLCRGTIPPSREQISLIKMRQIAMKNMDKSDPDYEQCARKVKQFEAEYGEDWESTAIEYGNDCINLPLYVIEAAKGGNIRTALQWLGKGNIKDRINAKCEIFGNAGLLITAALTKEYDLMTFLLLNGADVNITNSTGASVLALICDKMTHLSTIRLLLSWGAELFHEGKQISSQEFKQLVDSIVLEGNAASVPPNTRDDLVGKMCVVGRHIGQYEVTVEFTNESLLLGADNLERCDRTPQDPGYFVECKNNRLLRRDFESNEECRAFIASLGPDEGGLTEVNPEAEARAEQAAADLLAELGLDDLEDPSSNAPKKGARSAPPAGKKKKRGGKKKGRK